MKNNLFSLQPGLLTRQAKEISTLRTWGTLRRGFTLYQAKPREEAAKDLEHETLLWSILEVFDSFLPIFTGRERARCEESLFLFLKNNVFCFCAAGAF